MKYPLYLCILPINCTYSLYYRLNYQIWIYNKEMLITIVHTANYGKLVLHKYPYEKIGLEQEGIEKMAPNDMLEVIT